MCFRILDLGEKKKKEKIFDKLQAFPRKRFPGALFSRTSHHHPLPTHLGPLSISTYFSLRAIVIHPPSPLYCPFFHFAYPYSSRSSSDVMYLHLQYTRNKDTLTNSTSQKQKKKKKNCFDIFNDKLIDQGSRFYLGDFKLLIVWIDFLIRPSILLVTRQGKAI